ncbi:MAG: alpha/beta hydrolase fold domain-containing protein, partial [Candidatus Binatia bacterium]
LSLIGAWLTWNAFRPIYAPARRALLSFFCGWLTAELALHHVVLHVLVTFLFAAAGAFDTVPGQVGLWIAIISWVILVVGYFRSASAAEVVECALADGLGADYESRIHPKLAARLRDRPDWKQIALPFPMRHPDVERTRDIVYSRVRGVNLKLDVYRHRSHPERCPVLLEVHGGGWVLGTKNEQGIPLMLRMAAQGWVCVGADYRLSPHATFPEHLIDLKKALAWIREHITEYGGDPDYVIVTGQSAGGHLASLMALTANDPELQPGFESVDTTIQGCVSFYGVYDFLDRHGLWKHKELARVLEQYIMKASPEEAPEAYEKASPMSHISADDPPFFVIHGGCDSLVPVAEARQFCQSFRAVSRSPVVYAEIPGAQHAFEIFPSLRGEHVLSGVERFLAVLYSQHLAQRSRENGESEVRQAV